MLRLFLIVSVVAFGAFFFAEWLGYGFGTDQCRVESASWSEENIVCDDQRTRRSIRSREYSGGK